MDKELKALKEGKDNSVTQITTIQKEIQDAKYKEQQHADRLKGFEIEINLKHRMLKELKAEHMNRESSRQNMERTKGEILASI